MDGSAHAWHYPLTGLFATVNQGSQARGGKLPAFKDKLSEAETLAVLAYISSLCPDSIYATLHSQANQARAGVPTESEHR